MAENAQGPNWPQDASASTYSAPAAPKNPYLDKLKSYADPAAYQKLMDALAYGGQSDIGAQIFTPLSPDVLKDVPKTVEPATDVNEGGYVTPIGQSVPVGESNGIPVYANYDDKGKLTGFSGDQTYRAWVNGQQSYGGQWDASGNAKPQQYTSKGGGFFKGLAGDLATSFGGYGPLLANLALPGSGTAISLANAALNGGDFSKTLQNLAISQAVGQSGLGGIVSDATESPILGRLASGAASGVLRGQDIGTALTNSAIGAGLSGATSSNPSDQLTVPVTSLEEDLSNNNLSSNDLFNSVISNQDTPTNQNGYYDEITGKFIPSEFGSPKLDDTSGTGTMEGWDYNPETQTWTSPDGTETDLSHLSNSQTPLDTSKLNDSSGSNDSKGSSFLTPSMLNNILKYGGMAAGAGAIGSLLGNSGGNNPSIPNEPPVPLQNQTVNWNPQTGVSQDGVAYGLAQLQPTYTPSAAQGGIMSLAGGGMTSGIGSLGGYAAGGNPRLLRGPGDGMSDNIPATIAGKQPARLADGEFVVPADVVSHLGNGSTEAGANVLYQMMERVRKARTGNEKQGRQINPQKFIPSKGK